MLFGYQDIKYFHFTSNTICFNSLAIVLRIVINNAQVIIVTLRKSFRLNKHQLSIVHQK